MKSLLFIVLSSAVSICLIQSSSIPVFTTPYCSDYMADLPITANWISLCGSSVQSLIIPPNKTVAFYEQCRDDDATMSSADPMYKTIIQTTTEANCVSFFVNENEDISQIQVSIQFIDDFSKVCQEYADHIVKFCARSNGYGCDSNECRDAMHGAEEMKQQCDGYFVNSPSFRHRRHRYRREDSTSEESSHPEKENDQEVVETESLVQRVRNTKRLEMRLHNRLIRTPIITTTTKSQQQEGETFQKHSTQQRNQTGISMPYKKFMRKSHRICEPRRQRTVVTCSLISLVALFCLCCCCARCFYKKRCQRRQNQLLPAVPLEEDAPQRIVVAAIIPMGERQQPQVILSRVVDPQEAKQIEADHQIAVQLSKQ